MEPERGGVDWDAAFATLDRNAAAAPPAGAEPRSPLPQVGDTDSPGEGWGGGDRVVARLQWYGMGHSDQSALAGSACIEFMEMPAAPTLIALVRTVGTMIGAHPPPAGG